jgi:hypothetical protein
MDNKEEIVTYLKALTGNWHSRSNMKRGKFDQELSWPKLEYIA